MILASIRFTDTSYAECSAYRRTHGYPAIYGSVVKIGKSHPIGAYMFVLEMNNTTNTIEGVGVIKNHRATDKYYPIHINVDFNRHVYKGCAWRGRDYIMAKDNELIELLQKMVFRGHSHLKRIPGITALTNKLFCRWQVEYADIFARIHALFENKYMAKTNPLLTSKFK